MIILQQKKQTSFRTKIKRVIFSLFIFCVLLTAGLITFFETKYADKFYPGVSIVGESVDGKTYSEVLNKFSKKMELINQNGLIFNIKGENGAKQVSLPPFSSGLTTDKVVEHFSLENWENTLKQAYSVGHEGSIWKKAYDQIIASAQKRNFVFAPIIQKETVDSFFKDGLEDFLAKTSPSEFEIKDGSIIITKEIIGEEIDTTKINNILTRKLSLADPSPANLTADKNLPLSTNEKLKRFLNFAKQLKDTTEIDFNYNGNNWKVDGNTLATWLAIKHNDRIGVDEEKLEKYFNKTVLSYIDSPMQNSHFEMRDGKLTEISPGKTGNVVDIKKTTQNIEDIISNMADTMLADASIVIPENNIISLPIKITTDSPKITKETVDKYKIKELVGTATTNFEGGSLDRQHNIEVGASKLNGILIAPGEEFSAVNAIGDISEEAGFVKEEVINAGKVQRELGGGLCQIATTLFRLALNAGLPITERMNHRYIISYYGAGLDATIYGPHPDFRFINDTGNYLLLQGRAENNETVLELYGKKDGRVVEISKPVVASWIAPPPTRYVETTSLAVGKTRCTLSPGRGAITDVAYNVTYPNGDIKKTDFHSVYQPWRGVCLVGTKN